MNLEKRISELEKKAGTQSRLTLEDLVAASYGNPEASLRVKAGGDANPLIRLILETGKRGI